MVRHGRKERRGRTSTVRSMMEGILSRVLSFCEKAGMMPIEVPDDLYRQAKAVAALRGLKLKDLFEEGLRLVLKARRKN